MSCKETSELVTGFVDDQLSTDERSSYEAHLRVCAACVKAVSRERQIKARMRAAGRMVTAPLELRAALQQKYGVQRTSWWVRAQEWCRFSIRPVPAVALLALIAVPVALLVMESSRQGISLETLRTHEAVVSGAVPYTRSDSAQVVAQELSRAVGGEIVPPIYDLGKFDLHTAGGFQEEVGGRDVLVTVYKGSASPLTCHAFLGDESDIPEGARLVYDPADGRKLFTFSNGAVNGVLQRYGDEVCVLVSTMPMDDLVRIARSVQHQNHI